MDKKLELGFQTMDGRKSIDAKVNKLLNYVNSRINVDGWGDKEEVVSWGIKTIEDGIKKIVSDGVVYLK